MRGCCFVKYAWCLHTGLISERSGLHLLASYILPSCIFYITHSSSIILVGGKASNRPRPSNS